MKLYIDDLRTPLSSEWKIVRSSTEAIDHMRVYGCPSYISFDHDLGGEDTAIVVIKWMIECDLDFNAAFFPSDFQFNIHSANPVGSENIRGLLEGYLNNRLEPIDIKINTKY